MFDCLETHTPTADCRAAAPQDAATQASPLTAVQISRRHPGRSWLRLRGQGAQAAQLARAREVALYLDAEVERLDDGSLLIVGLNLNATLTLSERFGRELACEAQIASAAQYG